MFYFFNVKRMEKEVLTLNLTTQKCLLCILWRLDFPSCIKSTSIITYVYIYVIIDIFCIYSTDLTFFINVMNLIGIFFLP